MVLDGNPANGLMSISCGLLITTVFGMHGLEEHLEKSYGIIRVAANMFVQLSCLFEFYLFSCFETSNSGLEELAGPGFYVVLSMDVERRFLKLQSVDLTFLMLCVPTDHLLSKEVCACGQFQNLVALCRNHIMNTKRLPVR